MKVVVTGAAGQLATELALTKPEYVELVALSRADLDITDAGAVKAFLLKEKPDAIINAAAYTAVDKAEADELSAQSVNAKGVENLAKACAADTYFLHISTDFVFDGEKNRPYLPSDKANPKSVYGRTKLAGEHALTDNKDGKWAIVRTSWVYSAYGANFVKSMLRFMAERPALNIVVDQVGTPTWAKGLALVCWQAVQEKLEGIHHWSDAGACSWYDFAEVIQGLALEKGLLEHAIPLNAIPTEDYPLPAARPAYSVLDKTSILQALSTINNSHWQKHLSLMLDELKIQSK